MASNITHRIGSLSGTSMQSDTADSTAKVSQAANLRSNARTPDGGDGSHPSPIPGGIRPHLSAGSQTYAADLVEPETEETEPARKYSEDDDEGKRKGVPVYVMMPVDSVTLKNTVNRREAINASFGALKSVGVEGVTMDVWWGLVERDSPGLYNWGGYTELLEMAKKHGLKVQAVMSFHQYGAFIGSSFRIPLPKWVVEEIEKNPDLAYTDQWGRRNYEYISLGCDDQPVLQGRTPLQCYSGFMCAFRNNFKHLLGNTIVEIQVGMGPAGELRYPSHPESGQWKFPGIGAFQCYDKYMLSSLKAAAEAAGKPEWGLCPTDAGCYNDSPEDTPFFRKERGTWSLPYGEFFLTWYSQMLLDHGNKILMSSKSIFDNTGIMISVKIAGIHWHYGSKSHAPELTAGYYNTCHRDGYLPIAQMLARHGAVFKLTCIEMRDNELPQDALCAPEKLMRQVILATRQAQVMLAGENAMPRYDDYAYEQIIRTSKFKDQIFYDSSRNDRMWAFSYLRMNRHLFQEDNWKRFVAFVQRMKEGKPGHKYWDSREQVERLEVHYVHVTQPLVNESAPPILRDLYMNESDAQHKEKDNVNVQSSNKPSSGIQGLLSKNKRGN